MRTLRFVLGTFAVILCVGPAAADPVTAATTISPPTFAKTFGAARVSLGGITSLAFVIDNPNAAALSGIGFTDPLPSGLVVATPSGAQSSCGGTLTAIPGSGSVSLSGVTLIANDTCNFSVKVRAVAPGTQVNVAGPITSNEGGTGGTASATTEVSPSDLAVAKTHVGDFARGQTDAMYTIAVSNVGAGPSAGTVTVTDTLPASLIATALTGPGWSCDLASLTCTRSDSLAQGARYPDIALTVDVSAAAPASVTNRAAVSGGGDTGGANNTVDDQTTIGNPALLPRADFDGDGKVDILWRNLVTGENTIWLMNGTAVKSQSALPRISDLNWMIVAVGDLTADGKSDIVWRNQATGENTIWVMNATLLASQAPLPPVFDLNWQIRAVADFNGDGRNDLLWRNTSTGENTVWFMNGTSVTSTGSIPRVPDTNWQIVGTSDFSGDGKPDILWRNLATGENTIWVMNGTLVSSLAAVPPVTDLNWEIGGVGDVTADGMPDIVWRNSATGADTVWEMTGTTVLSAVPLPTVTDLGWKILQR
ncbi:MAG: FG-GAP-like repeat-containing protein [Acidobacteriota bacterium]